jgi:hypothetical protein
MQRPEFRAVTVPQKSRRGPSGFTRITDRANPEQAPARTRSTATSALPLLLGMSELVSDIAESTLMTRSGLPIECFQT